MELNDEISPRKRHSGFPASERASRFKIFVLLSFAPFLAWYANQPVNNPWQMRSSFYFTGDTIVLFQENNRGTSGEFHFLINENPPQNIDIYGWEIRPRIWGVSIVSGDTGIVAAKKNFEKNFNISKTFDILVSTAETAEELAEERRFFRPKITIWFAENIDISPAKNVYIPKPDEKFRVVKNRGGFEVLPIK